MAKITLACTWAQFDGIPEVVQSQQGAGKLIRRMPFPPSNTLKWMLPFSSTMWSSPSDTSLKPKF